MDWKQLADRAKDEVDKRGGAKSVKEDVEELRDIAAGEGTLSEKLKRATGAIREPGAHHDDAAATQPGAPTPGGGRGASEQQP